MPVRQAHRLLRMSGSATPAPTKKEAAPALLRTPLLLPPRKISGDLGGLQILRVAQHVAAAPDRLDIIVAAAGEGELLAELADEDVDDLQLRLVHAAVEVVEELFLGERRALAEREQLQHRIFLAGQMHPGAVDLDRLGVEDHGELAGADDRLRMALR